MRSLPSSSAARTWIVASVAAALVCCALPAVVAAQPAGEPPEQHETAEASPAASMVLRAFGSVQWGATEQPDTPSSFTLGQFAVFMTSNLSERLSVLAEIVLEGGVDTRVVTDLERLQLTFRFDDHVQLTGGRYHTGIGFYNAAFHHGAFFETPVGRPRAFAFEDEGGLLPVHDVGLSVRGAVPGTGLGIRYLAEVGNGRSWGAEHGEGVERDSNAAKALNLGLSYSPPRLRGFEVGGSYYRDTIESPSGADVPHQIGTLFVIYRTPTAEAMAEWLTLTHEPDARYVSHAGYAQFSRLFGEVRPYYRYDRLALDAAAPFIGEFGGYTGHTIGVRVEPAQWVGLKAQYERTDQAGLRGVDAVRTQLVFVF